MTKTKDNFWNELENFGLELFDASAANPASTSTSDISGQDLTLERVMEAKRLLDEIKDPLAEYMREKGFDPDKGDMIVLPENMRNIFDGLPLPSYARVSKLVDKPYMVKGFRLNLNDIKLSIRK
jgi:hypothetical protein